MGRKYSGFSSAHAVSDLKNSTSRSAAIKIFLRITTLEIILSFCAMVNRFFHVGLDYDAHSIIDAKDNVEKRRFTQSQAQRVVCIDSGLDKSLSGLNDSRQEHSQVV